MLRITKIHIKRFRSILDLHLEIDGSSNLITICGENNTGKTNTLRAIDLFFNPSKFQAPMDAPHHKFEASRGGAVYPQISIEFLKSNSTTYRITKKFNINGLSSTKGVIVENKKRLSEVEVNEFLEKEISVFFLESININFPSLINNLINELYDIEFEKTRLRGLKSDLKDSFETYINGLLYILDKLAEEINPYFEKYHADWGIGFDSNKDIQHFRDLITNDINFFIKDKSNNIIEGKGSGLQRLAYLLIYFRIIQKIKSKSAILLIDEPDIFLHHGIQKQLFNDLVELSTQNQIIMTTHSPIFIDSYKLTNLFLLELHVSQQLYKRKAKEYNILETKLVELNEANGARKIRQYLGIKERDYDVLDSYNIIVEGNIDKKYFEELMHFFNIEIPNIISSGGADNIATDLEWYNTFYTKRQYKPFVLVLLDNDNKGREVYKRISVKSYKNLQVQIRFTPNFLGAAAPISNLQNVNTNHEIEDFVYPEIITELINRILLKKEFKPVDIETVMKKITKPAFNDNGILSLIENEKNNKNLDKGNEIKISSQNVKKSMASIFHVEADPSLIKLLSECSRKYHHVQKFLEEICKPPDGKLL